ncbi:hypothetical protein E1A91_D05G046600v1 [Gossypium mustelinum]|uniref:NAD-dependent epimerase/dehydratase domain-containing protein n=1 Tax=Gossypium mustelinum TaxID=34275 RepID=A0A5D2UQ38_GOSMU|nr:hypothetical protein E1A91_D05G046600v1 [Gossypium mustelinum]
MEGDKGTVCLTGGTGFIGSWLIKRLLQEGYSVRTTVRADPENKRDLTFLTSLPGVAEKLKIFSADLNDPNSFDAAIEGSKAVLHVATPLSFDGKESLEAVTERSKTVKRVVYTSSAATVIYNGQETDMMDESFWTDVDFVTQKLNPKTHPYLISKTFTERAVLEFGTQHGLDVVTVNPGLVVGPFICPKFPDSVRSSLALYGILLNIPMVHVDDVARAHIFLLEYPDYPEFPIPSPETLAEIEGPKLPGVSSKKLLGIGFEFNNGLEEMFDGAIQCCKERGYL